jgi:ArsR family transcriptional regulator
MESAQLLDILGNENRRKILHLLASRPCYMSEIAERLDVGAKAVLGHLLLLEKAGLIEASVDEQRRKYFHIMDNLRMEVFVSPYSFEVEISTIAVSDKLEKPVRAIADLKSLYNEIQELLQHRQRIMGEYQEVQAKIAEAMGQSMDAIEDITEDSVEAEILYALMKSPMNKRALSMQLELPEYVLEEFISRMQNKEMIKENGNIYSIG